MTTCSNQDRSHQFFTARFVPVVVRGFGSTAISGLVEAHYAFGGGVLGRFQAHLHDSTD